jgi:hypothetical protein
MRSGVRLGGRRSVKDDDISDNVNVNSSSASILSASGIMRVLVWLRGSRRRGVQSIPS